MSIDPQIPAPDPKENEPTVLDLFKSVTKDWRSFLNFILSAFSAAGRAEVESAALEEARREVEEPSVEVEPAAVPSELPPAAPFPWRSLGAMVLAIFGQTFLEPSSRRVELALAFYLFAMALVIWAFIKDEWQLPTLLADLPGVDTLSVRPVQLALSVVFGLIAFWDFTGNLFTVTNVSLWALALIFLAWAFWQGPGLRAALQRVRASLARDHWQVHISYLGIIILVMVAVVLFFRVYRIDGVPSEPFSDHAEKILDVYDVTQGQTHIFFPRNTGREAIQMYWTVLMSWVFGTGLSFLSLKIGTVLFGILTLPYIYLLGKELGSPRVGLLAMFLFGIGYWPNVIARIGLRFPLYPLFVAPTLLYLIRGLRTRTRNDFILSGLFLGLGLHGYSPFRIMPFVVVAAFVIYLLHSQSKGGRKQAVWWLGLVTFTSLFVFLPLMRYALENPEMFSYRAFSRLGTAENPLSGPAWQVFLSNLWNGLKMFNWDDGNIWVNSVPHRPALDIVTGALFLLGAVLVIVRYARRRDWRDLFLLVSIPLLLMPSILSLAFPDENPALNRAGGGAVPAILIAALALDGLITAFGSERRRLVFAWGLTGVLLVASAAQNYDIVFHQFGAQYRAGAWNTSEMGKVISNFRITYGETDTVWIVPFPYWVDTRLPGVWAGIPNRDFALFREDLPKSLDAPYPKLFMFRPEDTETQAALRQLYPNGTLSRYTSAVDPSKDFMLFFVASK